jgi:predicted dehydrogenase
MGPAEDRVTLYGTQGGLDRAAHFSPTPSLKQYRSENGQIVESTPDISQYQPDAAAWIKAIASFVDAVRGTAPLVVLPEQALQVIRVLEAIHESAQAGREVAL